MYVSKINIQQDVSKIRKYIEENSFATMVSIEGEDFHSTHVPLILKEEEDGQYLYGHISIANQQKISIKNESKVLVTFMEKHTYISSSWYDHVNVPTWNYIAVHIHGMFQNIDNELAIKAMHSLVDKYEKNNPNRFKIEQMEEKAFHREMKGIVSFRIKIEKTDASWKLSNNRDDKNFIEIIKKLRERGDEMSLSIADEMESDRPLT